jgi:hypothetical protein
LCLLKTRFVKAAQYGNNRLLYNSKEALIKSDETADYADKKDDTDE